MRKTSLINQGVFMQRSIQRNMQINGWDFEVVQVRARKTQGYGQPYSCTATLNFIDNTCYIEGMLAKDSDHFNKADGLTFLEFGSVMAITSIEYTRYHYDKKNQQTHNRKVSIKI
jgi:hypothetical protein